MFFNRQHSFMTGLIFGLMLATLIFAYGFFSHEGNDVSDTYFSAPYGSYEFDEYGEDELYQFKTAPDESEFRWEV